MNIYEITSQAIEKLESVNRNTEQLYKDNIIDQYWFITFTSAVNGQLHSLYHEKETILLVAQGLVQGVFNVASNEAREMWKTFHQHTRDHYIGLACRAIETIRERDSHAAG
jgi:hypothetical protein